ncbi:MAG: glycosyltransferase, partial [Planctomycetota bacterium]
LVAGARRRAWPGRRARRLGVAGRIHEVGYRADPRPLYVAADVLVHPTFHDPCSLACLEALAMGVPVITTPANGVGELMGPRGGIVVEAIGDPSAVAVAVAVLADPLLRAATAQDARRVARRSDETRRLDRVLEICGEVGGRP